MMFKIFMFLVIPFVCSTAMAQEPVTWSFSAKKLNGSLYEVRMTAIIQSGWHLYSQKQPENAIVTPTNIRFGKHPLVMLKGEVEEKGDLVKVKEETIGFESWLYESKVQFIQIIELRNKVKTSINGSVDYQACTNEKCLPPATAPFSIVLQE